MSYKVKARYYAEDDNNGESYVITSDNSREDLKLEVGQCVDIIKCFGCDGCGTQSAG